MIEQPSSADAYSALEKRLREPARACNSGLALCRLRGPHGTHSRPTIAYP